LFLGTGWVGQLIEHALRIELPTVSVVSVTALFEIPQFGASEPAVKKKLQPRFGWA
jgi:hypothetical protein